MTEDAPRWLKSGGHQHRGPDDRVESGDVFADDVNRGPALRELVLVRTPPRCRDVVEQGIKPDVHDVAVIPRDLDAPVKGRP